MCSSHTADILYIDIVSMKDAMVAVGLPDDWRQAVKQTRTDTSVVDLQSPPNSFDMIELVSDAHGGTEDQSDVFVGPSSSVCVACVRRQCARCLSLHNHAPLFWSCASIGTKGRFKHSRHIDSAYWMCQLLVEADCSTLQTKWDHRLKREATKWERSFSTLNHGLGCEHHVAQNPKSSMACLCG